MLAILRVVAVLFGLGVVGFTLAYFGSGDRKYLRRAWRTFLAGLATAFVFFAVLFVQRLF
jgi:VIT1/CCC1 family predicted Fe2+/Mn2+ transporter